VNAYRLSIAWSRVLPNGRPDSLNEKGQLFTVITNLILTCCSGIAYYKDLIAKLKANNIEPIVTMHHWDNPKAIENEGGFLNEVHKRT